MEREASPLNSQLCRVVEQYTQHCKNLYAILLEELRTFKESDIETFETVVEQKQKLSSVIQALESRFTQLLQQCGISDPKNIPGFFQNSPQPLPELYSKLSQAALSCREQNAINARAVNLACVQTKQLLNVLQGLDSETSTYSESGKLEGESLKKGKTA